MLIDEIKKASMLAMKERKTDERIAYSMVISRYQGLLTSGKGGEVGDKEVINLLMKFAKELEEEKENYAKAGREGEVASLQRQIDAVNAFLPKLMSDDEVNAIIASLDDKSIPAVMRHFKANYDGKVDMGRVSFLARQTK